MQSFREIANDDSLSIRKHNLFYVTAGRGTECFVSREITERFKIERHAIHVRDGKVFFVLSTANNSFDLQSILSLKSVERVFIAIKDYDNSSYILTKRTFLDKLMAELSTTENFVKATTVLRQLNRLLRTSKSSRSKPCPCNSSMDCSVHLIPENVNHPSDTQNAVLTKRRYAFNDKAEQPCVKRMAMNDFDTCMLKTDPVNLDAQRNTLPVSQACSTILNSTTNTCHSDTDSLDYYQMSSVSEMGDPFTFRMSVKCSGKVKRWLDIKKLSRDLAWRVSRASGWSIDMHSPDAEVCVHISDEHVTAGVPLTKVPLSQRCYVADSGLRGPVAWIMFHLAEIQTGDTVLDPMCGKGTLLLEACSETEDAAYFGIDVNLSQIEKAAGNVHQSNFEDRIMLMVGNSLQMSFKDASVDRVLCDAPFNQKHLTSCCPRLFFHTFLTEVYRVLRPGGRFVLLCSQDLRPTICSFLESCSSDMTCPGLSQTRFLDKESKSSQVNIFEDMGTGSSQETVTSLGKEANSILQKAECQDKRVKSPHLRNMCQAMDGTDTQQSAKIHSVPASPLTLTGTEAVYLPIPFILLSCHYVKLGETHADIMVMNKS